MKNQSATTDRCNNLSTLVELLQHQAITKPQHPIYTLLTDGETEEIRLTFAEFEQQSREIATLLHQSGASGKRALLLYPPGLEYIIGFMGCLYAGVTAVPAYPPDPTRLNRTLPRLQAMVADAQASYVLTTTPILAMAQMVFEKAPELHSLEWIATDQATLLEPDVELPTISPDTLAFLQYTSGSTGMPKGVMLTHANLMHNQKLISEGFGLTPQDKAVIWLPPYHDMGLIGGILQPLYTGFHCILMSPIAFLQRPFRWLQAMSRYQATISGGPNFAFDLCVRKVTREQRATLDLSHWRVAFNGAEPVRRETVDRFAASFESCGFQRDAFSPCYGLAEATLFVTGDLNKTAPVTCTVKKSGLAQNQIIYAANEDRVSSTKTLIGCGQSSSDQSVVIANPETRDPLADDQIGEIWVSGKSIAQGYWNRPQETAEIFQAHLSTGKGPFLRTGDLGFLHKGELFITGRVKDLIIIRGRNHFPQDIELTVEQCHTAVRPGCCAAFSVDIGREERLVVVLEIYTNKSFDLDDVIQTVRQSVANAHEVQVYAVVLIQPRTISKTSSGKIQRRASRQQYLDGTLAIVEANALENVSAFQKEVQFAPEPLLVKALRAMEPAPRLTLVTSHLQELLGQVAGLAPNQLDAKRPLPSLGLDSAMAVELTHEIESALGIPLRMENLLQDIAISDLASQLVTELTAPPKPVAVSTFPKGEDTPTRYPLSHGQRALWFLNQLYPESPAYNVVYAVRVRQSLDLKALRRALQGIISRHDTLRTTFTIEDGEPIQVVQPHQEAFVQVEDAAGWGEDVLNGRLSQEIYRPFDLANGPLLRLYIYKHSEQDHTILLGMHHIITDLWSLALLLHELDQFYQYETQGTHLSLKPHKISFAEYVYRQNDMLAAAEGDKLRQYWLNQLGGELPVLNLLADKPRPPVPTYHGACESIRIDKATTIQLKELGKSGSATLFMTLLAAFHVLLHRYTGQEDILVGSPKANRTRNVARMVGYFVNPIVIRANLADDPTFTDFLDQVRQTTLSAFAHSDYPFPLLVEQLQPVRDAAQSPIFQVMFAWEKTTQLINSRDIANFLLHESGQQMHLGDIPLESVALEDWVSPFDLTLLMAEAGDELIATFEYSIDIFEPQTIRRMLTHFVSLLNAIISKPNQPISRIPMTSQAEKTMILSNESTLIQLEPIQLVPHKIAHIAAKTPNAQAISLDNESLTYGELEESTTQLAHYLHTLGIQPGEPVGVMHSRSPNAIVAFLGILKAGGAYLPIEPTTPQERLRFLVADAGLRTLICESEWMPRLQSIPVTAVSLDTTWPDIVKQPKTAVPQTFTPDSTAYVIYTSGSTGTPKGVEISHEAIAQHLQVVCPHFTLTPADRVLQFAAFSFDQSIEQILATLTTGGTLIMRGDDIWEPDMFPKFVQESGLTVINLPPAYWEQTVNAWTQSQIEAPQLKLVIVGGDVLRAETITQWQKLPVGHVRLLNAYGPTETTITATTFEVPIGAAPPNRTPIGRPLPHRIMHILDKHNQPVPVGVPGELVIGGIGLAKGYLNRPELTAERFVQVDISREPLADYGLRTTVYRTGDLCRLLPDGNIEFLGRIDHQVKVRGFRIELGEIESVLSQHPQVAQTAVITHDTTSGKQLAAYLSVSKPPNPSAMELKRFLKKQLPDYMIPANFVILDELPMTPSGKINRRVLPIIADTHIERMGDVVAPRTPIEETLVEIWRDVLEVPQVGIFDNFFDLGGHSLLATRLASRVRDAFQIELSLRAMFEATTVADLAVLITQTQAEQTEDEDLLAVLEELEQLSTDDVQTLLFEELI